MEKAFHEINLDIRGPLTWIMAPLSKPDRQTSPPFVITECGKFYANSGFFYRREGRDGFLLLYVQSGKGLLKYNSGEYELLPGQIAIIDCYQHHEYRTFDGAEGTWIFYWLHFSSDNMFFYTNLLYRESYTLFNLGDEPALIFEDILENLPYGEPEILLLLNDCLYKIITLMMKAARLEKSVRDRIPAVKENVRDVVDYIKSSYWQPLGLEDLAKQSNMSKFHFIRSFKEVTGMTPYQYLTTERMNAAKILLQTTDMKVSEISIMVGFADESNFIKKFKSMMGVTPKSYRLNTDSRVR